MTVHEYYWVFEKRAKLQYKRNVPIDAFLCLRRFQVFEWTVLFVIWLFFGATQQ